MSVERHFSIIKTKIVILLFYVLFPNCGVFVGNPDEESDTTPKVVDNPSDSTGQNSPIALSFATSLETGSTLNLTGNDSGTIDLGDGLRVSSAKLHVGRIKLKTKKEESNEEKELEGELEQEEEDEEEEAVEKEAVEKELDDIEDKYDALIAAAATDEEKAQLEAQEEAEKKESEERIAEIESEREEEIEAIEDAEDKSLKWASAYVFDAITGATTPEIKDSTTLDGTYERIEFKIKPSRSTTENIELLNKSILISGTIVLNGTETSYEFSLREKLAFSLKGSGSITIDPNIANNLIILFKLADWFEGVDFSSATVNVRGEIKIDPINNDSLYKKIVENMKRSTNYGEDEDEDGELEDDEFEGDGDED